jgi:hypothetical protein
MSTWISEGPVAPRLWLAAPLILLLAGCFESAPLQRFSARDAVAGASVVTVAGGVAVAGPEGWCVDKTSTVEGAREAFVLLIRCRTGERRRPVLGATVTALPAAAADGDENLGALLRAIDSETGHGHLSRSGRAADVRIERTGIEAGAIWLRIHADRPAVDGQHVALAGDVLDHQFAHQLVAERIAQPLDARGAGGLVAVALVAPEITASIWAPVRMSPSIRASASTASVSTTASVSENSRSLR